MKKWKQRFSYFLLFQLVITSSLVVSAAPSAVPPKQVITEVEFNHYSGEIPVIKPGTVEEKIILPDGKSPVTVGGVQLTHVPHFNFGMDNTIEIKEMAYQTMLERFKKVDDGSGMTGYIPPFVQVGDTSQNTSHWSVQVVQDNLFNNTKKTHELANTRLKIHEETLTNNVKNNQVSSILSGGDYRTAKAIPVRTVDGNDNSLTVLSSPTGKTQNSISSVVFKQDYKENDYQPNSTQNDKVKNGGVRLHVPQNEKIYSQEYQANLIWTLTVGP